MVHAKAAVTPSNQKVMAEASPSVQQYTSLVNVQVEDDPVVTKPRSKTHRRHQSLFYSTSVPLDESDYPSQRRESSFRSDSGLRKSTSGSLNWKLGEFWSKFKAPVKENTTSTSVVVDAVSETTVSVDQKIVEKQEKIEILGFRKNDETGVVLPPLEQTREQEKDVNSVSTESHQIEEPISAAIANTSSASSRHTKVASPSTTSTTKSFHFTSLNLFSSSKFNSSKFNSSKFNSSKFSSSKFNSSKFSSSNDLDVNDVPSPSSVEQSGKLEPSETLDLSSKWTEIQGANYWHSLLDPLDLDLRKEILRYGDFAQLTYDNFECNTRSKYAGSARYPKQKLFQKLHKQGCGYEVTRYLYATSDNPLPGVLQSSLSSERWDSDSNWMGYVAIATDKEEIERLGRRDIVVAWRGAAKTIEWLVDAQTQMTPIRVTAGSSKVATTQCPKVEKGFWSLYTCKRPTSQFNRKSASEQVIMELRRLLMLYKGENLSITVTGHGLGGALAILTTYEFAARGLHKQGQDTAITVTAFTFGSPHIGDGLFRRRFEELQVKVLRVVNLHDVVPKSIANFYPLWGSSDANKHVGVELEVNHKVSTYLQSTRDPVDWHNLECYLHHVDGYQGRKSKSFELVTGRNYALVNKYTDVLQERFCIPAQWWQVQNKGLELSADGQWVEPDRAPEDTPSLANFDRYV